MEEKQFREITDKLNKIIKLLVIQATGEKTGRETIQSLSAVGFQPKDIADLIGTTPNTVSAELYAMKKKKVKKNAKED